MPWCTDNHSPAFFWRRENRNRFGRLEQYTHWNISVTPWKENKVFEWPLEKKPIANPGLSGRKLKYFSCQWCYGDPLKKVFLIFKGFAKLRTVISSERLHVKNQTFYCQSSGYFSKVFGANLTMIVFSVTFYNVLL